MGSWDTSAASQHRAPESWECGKASGVQWLTGFEKLATVENDGRLAK